VTAFFLFGDYLGLALTPPENLNVLLAVIIEIVFKQQIGFSTYLTLSSANYEGGH
jgi:hypothetical protein